MIIILFEVSVPAGIAVKVSGNQAVPIKIFFVKHQRLNCLYHIAVVRVVAVGLGPHGPQHKIFSAKRYLGRHDKLKGIIVKRGYSCRGVFAAKNTQPFVRGFPFPQMRGKRKSRRRLFILQKSGTFALRDN